MNIRYRELPIVMQQGAWNCLLAEPHSISANPAVLLNFAADKAKSLRISPYSIAPEMFLSAGHRAASMDLPCHGERTEDWREGISGLCAALLSGTDLFKRFVEEGRVLIDSLIEQGLATAGRIFVSGTSRGAYFALRLMAADKRIGGAAAFAPVTDWRVLVEFSTARDRPEVAELALSHYAAALANRTVWLAIGNHDLRVGTKSCMHLMESLLGQTNPDLPCHASLYVVPERGHGLADPWYKVGSNVLLGLASKACGSMYESDGLAQ